MDIIYTYKICLIIIDTSIVCYYCINVLNFKIVLSWLACPVCTIQADLSRLTCPGWSVQADLCRLPCPVCTIQADLSRLTCPAVLIRLFFHSCLDLSSWHGCQVPIILSRLSCLFLGILPVPLCPVLSRLTFQAGLLRLTSSESRLWLSCSGCRVLAVSSRRSCPGNPVVVLSCCHVPTALSLPSYSDRPLFFVQSILSCPCCPVLIVLSFQSCPGWHVQTDLSWLSYPGRPVIAVRPV